MSSSSTSSSDSSSDESSESSSSSLTTSSSDSPASSSSTNNKSANEEENHQNKKEAAKPTAPIKGGISIQKEQKDTKDKTVTKISKSSSDDSDSESTDTESTDTESSSSSSDESSKDKQKEKIIKKETKVEPVISKTDETNSKNIKNENKNKKENSEPNSKPDKTETKSSKITNDKNSKSAKKDESKSEPAKNDKGDTSSKDVKTRDIDPSDKETSNTDSEARKLDRYGWYAEKRKMSKREADLIKIEERKELERTKKWLEMTQNKNWKIWIKNKRNKVAERLKKGVPDSVRSRAWSLLTNSNEMKKKYPTPMEELLKKTPHEGYVVINKDLARTFPQIGFFAKPGFLESLRKVLCCYCQIDPHLGYTQGMSFIAGMFLAYMDDETAFYSFVNVMLDSRINHRGYHLPGFPRLESANTMLACLMDKKCPKVLKRMDQIGVCFQMFTPGWFLTAYQSYNWAPEFQLRIFERFLFYGTRGLLGFAFIIILKHQAILENAEIEVFLNVLQHPDLSEKMKDWHSVLEDWDKNWITKKEYESLLARVGAQKEAKEL